MLSGQRGAKAAGVAAAVKAVLGRPEARTVAPTTTARWFPQKGVGRCDELINTACAKRYVWHHVENGREQQLVTC